MRSQSSFEISAALILFSKLYILCIHFFKLLKQKLIVLLHNLIINNCLNVKTKRI